MSRQKSQKSSRSIESIGNRPGSIVQGGLDRFLGLVWAWLNIRCSFRHHEKSPRNCRYAVAGWRHDEQDGETWVRHFVDLWATLLNRYNIVSMTLESSSLDLNNAVALLESLREYVATLREQFDIFEKNRKALSGCSIYQEDSGRKRVGSIKLKRFEDADADVNLTSRQVSHRRFWQLSTAWVSEWVEFNGALKKRLDAYTLAQNVPWFFHKSLIWLQSQSAKVPTVWLRHVRKVWNTIWRMTLCIFAASPKAREAVFSMLNNFPLHNLQIKCITGFFS